ncbi:MAG TPA: response regulator [Aggregatilineaceae bacterium]|nr:response regulator [Aggregatilineaceae bacterium]
MNLAHWRVLVVEDEVDSMELVRGLLEHHSIRCIPASTAEEALHVLETETPTLILIDLNLPGLDGWGLLRHIQLDARLDRTPCVAVTAYHTAEVANLAIEAGFDAYFAKPLEATSFVRELVGIVEE